jgi:hypothetical protein
LLNFIDGEGATLNLHFAFVYILEAHASDKWPMRWAVEWPEAQSLADRRGYAKTCDSDLGWSRSGVDILVDGMNDSFCHSLAAWPAGGYVLGPDRQLLYVCAPPRSEVFFEEEQLFSFLREKGRAAVGGGKAEEE